MPLPLQLETIYAQDMVGDRDLRIMEEGFPCEVHVLVQTALIEAQALTIPIVE